MHSLRIAKSQSYSWDLWSVNRPFTHIFIYRNIFWASLVAQRLKRLPGMRETWVWSLSWEDPLEKEMATHSSTLAWRIPWMEEPGRLQSMGLQRVGHDWATSLSLSIYNTYIWTVTVATKLKHTCSYDKPRAYLKADITLPTKVHSQTYGFSCCHVQVWELDHKEGWVLKSWCFKTVVLEKTLERPLGKEIKPVHPKGNQPWIFIGRTGAETEAPIL